MKVRLFIKPFCGWCHVAMRWLDGRSIPCEKIGVLSRDSARDEVVCLSNQDLMPVTEVDDRVLADFGPDQLAGFWNQFEKQ